MSIEDMRMSRSVPEPSNKTWVFKHFLAGANAQFDSFLNSLSYFVVFIYCVLCLFIRRGCNSCVF